MAEKSGFFNAIRVGDSYDRKYNANDYSDNLAVVISNGVLRSTNDDLKVTAAGMVASVNVGRAWINGKYYKNDTSKAMPATTAPLSGSRYDRIVLRLDNSVGTRSIVLAYLQGTAAVTPSKPSLTRSGDIYELCLADIYITAGGTSITVTDTRSDASLCGWVYSTSGDNSFFTSLDAEFDEWFADKKDELSSVTLFKRYSQSITLDAASTTVTFNIPQYDADTCFIEVYVNGIFETRYTRSGSVLTFAASLVAGTEVKVNVYKSIDGTGIQTVSDEITALQNAVATMTGRDKYTYKCTGTNDNVALSQIADWIYNGTYPSNSAAVAFATAIGGSTWRAGLNANAQITVEVVGRCGVTAANGGTGVSSDYYKWFELGSDAKSTIRVTFDFAHCEIISVSCAASTYNNIFSGVDIYIKNAKVSAASSGTSCFIYMFGFSSAGDVIVDDCDFKVESSDEACIARHGTFTNCIGETRSTGGHSSCFACGNNNLVRVFGGKYKSYYASVNKYCACFWTSGETAVLTVFNANCPVEAVTGYSQPYFYRATSGAQLLNGVISTLSGTGAATLVNILSYNKP